MTPPPPKHMLININNQQNMCTVKYSILFSGKVENYVFDRQQKWMWVEKGVPGVSTCTVWQSEYPWFLICPFSHVVSLTTPTLCEVWEVSCNSFHKPYPQLERYHEAPGAITPPKHRLHGISRHSTLDDTSITCELWSQTMARVDGLLIPRSIRAEKVSECLNEWEKSI